MLTLSLCVYRLKAVDSGDEKKSVDEVIDRGESMRWINEWTDSASTPWTKPDSGKTGINFKKMSSHVEKNVTEGVIRLSPL